MKRLLSLNKAGPGPGTYTCTLPAGCVKLDYKPVVVLCFFKGADKCSLCGELLYGDYYKDKRKKKTSSWCLQCFRFALPVMTRCYLESVQKHRHCSFAHKHIDVENIVYRLIPQSRVRRLLMKEKAMWNKYGEIRDNKGLPAS